MITCKWEISFSSEDSDVYMHVDLSEGFAEGERAWQYRVSYNERDEDDKDEARSMLEEVVTKHPRFTGALQSALGSIMTSGRMSSISGTFTSKT